MCCWSLPRNADNPFIVMKEYLIKTFDKKEYAERFLKDGEMLFRNVSYFRKIEDDRVIWDYLSFVFFVWHISFCI